MVKISANYKPFEIIKLKHYVAICKVQIKDD